MSTDTYVVQPGLLPRRRHRPARRLRHRQRRRHQRRDAALHLASASCSKRASPSRTCAASSISMRDAAREAGVHIVTGDTKVVEKGHGDGIFINTAGVGVARRGRRPVGLATASPATRCCSRARSATTASRSSRRARASSSRRASRPTPRRSTRSSPTCSPPRPTRAASATPPAAAWPRRSTRSPTPPASRSPSTRPPSR